MELIKKYLTTVVGAFTTIGFLVGAMTWTFTTFALADDLRETNIEVIQMQIDSTSKEIRSYKREMRRAKEAETAQMIEQEMQEAIDEREKLRKRQSRVAGG